MSNIQKLPNDPRDQVIRAHAQLTQAKVPQDPSLSKRLGTLLDTIDNVTAPLIPEVMLMSGTLAKVNVAAKVALNLTAWLDFKGLRKEAMKEAVKLQRVKHPDPKKAIEILWLPGETPEHFLRPVHNIYMHGHEDAASHVTDPENTCEFEVFEDVMNNWISMNSSSLAIWMREQKERPHGLAHLYLHYTAWLGRSEVKEYELLEVSVMPDGSIEPTYALEWQGINLLGHDITPAEPLPDSMAPRQKKDDDE